MTADRPDGPRDRPGGRRAPIRVHDRRVVRPEEEGIAAGSASAPEPSLEERVEQAQKLADERLDQLKRAKADFENARQRMVREQTEIVERASQRVVERLLPILDDLERAVRAAETHSTDQALVRGVELVLKQMHEVLSSEGLERMDSTGQPFDPREHEAMASEPGDVPEPTVLEVVRPGYRLKGRTIRPALVRVTTPSQAAQVENAQAREEAEE